MRVIFVIDTLGPGGAERSTALMLPYLRDRGVDASIATLRTVDNDSGQFLRQAGFRIDVLPPGDIFRQGLALRRLIKELQPDIVHTALWTSDQVGRIAVLGTRSKVISSLVTVPRSMRPVGVEHSNAGWKLAATDAFDRLTRRIGVAQFQAVSPGVARAYSEVGKVRPSRITVAERGRPREQLGERTVERRAAVRVQLGIGDATPLVVAAGRHEAAKAHTDLIRAIAVVSRTMPTVRVVIAGRSGKETARLQASIESHGLHGQVTLLGHREDVPDLLAAADVMALPSHFEGNAGIVLEAMGLGVPIASSRLAGQFGVLVDGQNALLHEPGDIDQLAKNLECLLTDGQLRDRLGRNARDSFDRRFEMSVSVERQIEMYRSVLGLDRVRGVVAPTPHLTQERPSISVVMPSFNCERTIAGSVTSVLAQLGPIDQLIIVDDGSTDGTAPAVAILAADQRVDVVTQENNGPSAARNAGAQLARGEVLAFIDSDDHAQVGWIDWIADAMGDPDVAIARCGAEVWVDDALESRVTPRRGRAADYPYGSPLAGTWAVRTSDFQAVGGYEGQLRFSENTELLIRLLGHSRRAGMRVVSTDRTLVRVSRSSKGRRNYSAAKEAAAALCIRRHAEVFSSDRDLKRDVLAVLANAQLRRGSRGLATMTYGRAFVTAPSIRGVLRVLYPFATLPAAVVRARRRRSRSNPATVLREI